jgi:DNA-binding GntR family transcriptional regulator
VSSLQAVAARSLGELAADELRTAIRAGRYAPGARLVERTLAGGLGISHIPVREALARLADEGLVECTPRRGCRVATLRNVDLAELADIRIVLEQLVVERIQQRLGPATRAELIVRADEMAAAARLGDVEGVLEIDDRIHERLWELADHRLLAELLGQLRGRLYAYLRAATLPLVGGQLELHARHHRDLLDAILSGDADRARAEMRQHVETAARSVQATIESGPLA